MGDQCGILVIYCHKHAKGVYDLIDHTMDQIAFLVAAVIVQVVVDMHGGAETIALIDVESGQNCIPHPNPFCLFLEGKKEVFGKSPVQKGADICHIGYPQWGCFIQSDIGNRGGGGEPVFGIPVEEYLQGISRGDPLGHLIIGKENLQSGVLIRTKIDTEF